MTNEQLKERVEQFWSEIRSKMDELAMTRAERIMAYLAIGEVFEPEMNPEQRAEYERLKTLAAEEGITWTQQ